MQFIKRIFQLSATALVISGLIIGSIPLQNVSAQAPKCDEEYYSSNDVLFYNPCIANSCSSANAGGALSSAGPTALIGESNEEKVWNYFIARGLTPVAAAGAMGNMQQESSNFDPWAGEHGSTGNLDKSRMGTGFGLIQWTNTGGDAQGRRYGVMKYLEDNGVTLNASDPAQLDKALLYELNYLWDGEYKSLTWQEQVNAEEKIEGDPSKSYSEDNTGNGSAMVFHKLVERSGDGATGKQERIDSAIAFLAQFDGTAARGACGTVGAGGLTWDQAVILGKKVVDEWDAQFCNGATRNSMYCSWGEGDGYCTAGAAWLTEASAGIKSGIPNGVDVANELVIDNPDTYTLANPDGSNLQPFSVWSFGAGSSDGQPGHTGTIVGIGTDGSIITLEVNWRGNTANTSNSFLYNPGHAVAVFQYPSFEAFKTARLSGYVYTATATPKDASVAEEMSNNMAKYIGS